MNKGFSLIEILVAITIVALLSVTATLGFAQQQKTGRDTSRITDIGNLSIAVEGYRGANNTYPLKDSQYHNTNDLIVLENQGFINKLPADPKPGLGTAQFDPPICANYVYASPTSWDGGRQYAFWFGAELEAKNGKHPLNQTVSQLTDNSCTTKRQTARVVGPK